MRRILLFALVPVALVVGNWALSTWNTADATVTIEDGHPSQLRATVMTTVESYGGRRTDEHTSFSANSEADLRFVVPTSRLEQILSALESGGGTVVDQDISYDQASSAASTVASGVDGVQACLGKVSGALTSQRSSAGTALSDCQRSLHSVSDQLAKVDANIDETDLAINIVQPTSFKWSSLLIILAVMTTLSAVGVLVFRAGRGDAGHGGSDRDASSPGQPDRRDLNRSLA